MSYIVNAEKATRVVITIQELILHVYADTRPTLLQVQDLTQVVCILKDVRVSLLIRSYTLDSLGVVIHLGIEIALSVDCLHDFVDLNLLLVEGVHQLNLVLSVEVEILVDYLLVLALVVDLQGYMLDLHRSIVPKVSFVVVLLLEGDLVLAHASEVNFVLREHCNELAAVLLFNVVEGFDVLALVDVAGFVHEFVEGFFEVVQAEDEVRHAELIL